jgi:GntR family transcriptional regulator
VSGRTLLADRLRDELLEEITSSALQPGMKLPSEGQLAKRFNVSRATVRDAVRALVEAGYVTRRHGSGSYVTERRRMPHALDSTLSYLAMIESAGARAGMRVLDAAFEQCCAADGPLQLSPGDTVLAVERVRTADDRPVIYSHDRIPARLLPTDLDLRKLDPSLFGLLSSSGHAADHATATLRAVASTRQTATVLGIRRGKPLLYIEEIDYGRDGTPVMLSREWHVSEAFDVRINRKAHPCAEHPYAVPASTTA